MATPVKKTNVDNKARFCYLAKHCLRIINASICWAEDDTQFAISIYRLAKKQVLVVIVAVDKNETYSIKSVENTGFRSDISN